jgi:hypothetical protein
MKQIERRRRLGIVLALAVLGFGVPIAARAVQRELDDSRAAATLAELSPPDAGLPAGAGEATAADRSVDAPPAATGGPSGPAPAPVPAAAPGRAPAKPTATGQRRAPQPPARPTVAPPAKAAPGANPPPDPGPAAGPETEAATAAPGVPTAPAAEPSPGPSQDPPAADPAPDPPRPDPADPPAPETDPPDPEPKPLLRGACDRQRIAAADFLPTVNCTVVKVTWAELQPEPFGSIVKGNLIDRTVAEAKRLNAADPSPGVRLKLRVYAGMHAPEWAKTLDGPAVPIREVEGAEPVGTVPRFWTDRFGAAYGDLMTKLAARYDGEDLVADVAVSRCMTLFAETFLRQALVDENRAEYYAAGYTVDQDRACHRKQLRTHARQWPRTRTSVAFNPFQVMPPTGRPSGDVAFALEMMDYCRQLMGARCVLGNNSIGWPPKSDDGYGELLEAILEHGQPIYFQMRTGGKVGDWDGTMEWAASVGTNMVEMNVDYDELPVAQVAAHDFALESNPTGDPDAGPSVPGSAGLPLLPALAARRTTSARRPSRGRGRRRAVSRTWWPSRSAC